ncbi:MAG: hypothetical protein Alpg2KO_31410 [Alphaproteobacteria bacterium]
MSPEARLHAYITDLAAGGGCAVHHLSADFGQHRGLDGPGWVAREEPEFSGRDLGDFSIRLLSEQASAGLPEQRFLVLSADGQLIYEDRTGFDAQGLLVGDQAPVELISKLEFRQGAQPRRALACKVPPGQTLLRVIPRDPSLTDVTMAEAAAEGQDGFTRLWLERQQDDFQTCTATLRFYLSTGAQTVATLMRGTDHPLFEDDNHARITASEITLPQNPERLWRVSLVHADGSTTILSRPKTQHIQYDRPVTRVIVTDPLDNDWITDA